VNSTKDIPAPAWWLRALGRVPLPVMYAVAALTAVLMRDLLRYRVAVARGNLRAALPERTEAERARNSAGDMIATRGNSTSTWASE